MKKIKWRDLLAKAGVKHAEIIPVDPSMHYVILIDKRYVSKQYQEALGHCLDDAHVKATFIRMDDVDRGFRFVELKP